MAERYEAIVIGVGGVGSAAVYHLASRGLDVLGLERYDIPHEMGSSHGNSRIIRKGQFEGDTYVPLVERSYTLWQDLETKTGRNLLHITGGLDAGPPDCDVFEGARQSCENQSVEHEVLSADEVNNRFSGYKLPPNHRAVYQPDSGFLVPEQCTVAHVEAAHEAGAEIRARESVTDYTPLSDGGVQVTTEKGSYEANRLVVTAGAWANKLLPELEAITVSKRQVLAWLQPKTEYKFDTDHFPIFVHSTEIGEYYGFPHHDLPGFKFGKHMHMDETVDPDEMAREPNPDDEQLLRRYAERFLPDGAGPTMRLKTCITTHTPDDHFILDSHPKHPQIVIGAGFSGHGFKCASALGEILADLTVTGNTSHDVDLFRLNRF